MMVPAVENGCALGGHLDGTGQDEEKI